MHSVVHLAESIQQGGGPIPIGSVALSSQVISNDFLSFFLNWKNFHNKGNAST